MRLFLRLLVQGRSAFSYTLYLTLNRRHQMISTSWELKFGVCDGECVNDACLSWKALIWLVELR